MRRYIILFIVALTAFSCTQMVVIEGHIANADDKKVTLEQLEVAGGIVKEITLNKNGAFKVKIDAVKEPDFYAIKVDNQSIILGLDSLISRIVVDADATDLLSAKIEGSEQSVMIQALRVSSAQLQKQAKNQPIEVVDSLLSAHKELLKKTILENTASPAAYYALNQRYKEYYYISTADRTELKFWAAVATAYELNYPNNWRTKSLKDIVLTAMSQNRRGSVDLQTLLNEAREDAFIDIKLPDKKGEYHSLSDYVGNVVLLDFMVVEYDAYPAHALLLNELYYKYHAKGLEIFQISFDKEKVLWLEKCRRLPWVSLYDSRSLNSVLLAAYNITELPTLFLMSRDGTIVGRYSQKEIEKVLESFDFE